MDESALSFGRLLRRCRRTAGLTQEQLGQRAGYSVGYVSMLERGTRIPAVTTVDVLTAVLQPNAHARDQLYAAAHRERAAGTDDGVPLDGAPPESDVAGGQPRRMQPEIQPASGGLDRQVMTLPLQPTSFIGRHGEIAGLVELLARQDVRLLTLTGPGGIGKTRLALEVAATLHDTLADGVRFVPLISVSDPDLVPDAITTSLGLRPTAGQSPLDALMAFVPGKEMLLVIDNFEHVPAAAPNIGAIIARSHTVRVLVTSRSALHLAAEHVYPVPPLSVPAGTAPTSLQGLSQCEGIQLFVARAAAARIGFTLTAANADAIAAICSRLDGLPLAIELAAARTRFLSPQAILRRLDRAHDAGALDLLVGGAHDVPTRQQTIRDTIEWSYRLLAAPDQEVMARLAVCAGSCALTAAEAICADAAMPAGDVSDRLLSLADQSLIQLADGPDGEPFVTMLQTIQEFARERLVEHGGMQDARARHAAYYLGLAEMAAPRMYGPEQELWFGRLEAEHANLRVALRWWLDEGRYREAQRMVTAMRLFWRRRGHDTEGTHWAQEALAGDGGDPTVRVGALFAVGELRHGLADYAGARALYREGLALARELGDERSVAQSLLALGCWELESGDYERASALLEESLGLSRRLGNERGVCAALGNLGLVAAAQGDYKRAATLHMQTLEQSRARGIEWDIATALVNLGDVLRRQGRVEQAAQVIGESLQLYRKLGGRTAIAECLEQLAPIANAHQRPEHAARLWGAAEALREAGGTHLPPYLQEPHDREVAAARASTAPAVWNTAWQQGRALTVDEAVALALETEGAPGELTEGRTGVSDVYVR